MKRLLITDLDGTLLNRDKGISAFTRQTISKTVENGDYFTVASARTPASAIPMLEGVSLNAPAILMNGVLVYDLTEKTAIKTEYIPLSAAEKVIQAFEAHNRYGFLYHYRNDGIEVHFRELKTACEQEFYQVRKGKEYKRFAKVEALEPYVDDTVVYFTVVGSRRDLEPLSTDVSKIAGVESVFYKDVYQQDVFYLEIFSANANKENGICFLRRRLNCTSVIAFGDNYNDMGMFRCADECYAVENSVPELKQIATATIPSNQEEGVAKKMAELLET